MYHFNGFGECSSFAIDGFVCTIGVICRGSVDTYAPSLIRSSTLPPFSPSHRCAETIHITRQWRELANTVCIVLQCLWYHGGSVIGAPRCTITSANET